MVGGSQAVAVAALGVEMHLDADFCGFRARYIATLLSGSIGSSVV